MVNDRPPPLENTNVGALHPHPTEQYGSSTRLAGSELTGSFRICLRLRVVWNLAAGALCFNSLM